MKTSAEKLAYIKEWQRQNPDRVRASQKKCREKSKTKSRIKKWLVEHVEIVRAYRKKWRQKHFVQNKEMQKKWKRNNHHKYTASKLVNTYVDKGLITKPTHCALCGEEKLTGGHHTDYTKRLFVVWLCNQCHRRVHVENIDVAHLGINYAKGKPMKTDYTKPTRTVEEAIA